MIDPYLLLAPILLLAIVASLGFVGCRFHDGQASNPPDAPTGLAPVVGDSWVQLNWTAVTGATSYTVGRGTTANTYTETFSSTVACYVDSPLTDGTTYHYAVQVTTADGTSVYSSDVSATPGAITYLQRAEIDVQAANTTTATSNPFQNPLTPSNLIVVWVWYNAGGNASQVAQISDTAGNQYSRIVPPTPGAGALTGFAQEIWYAKKIAAGAGVTITSTMTGNTTELAISGHEYTGADPNNPVVGMAATIGASANAAVGPVPTIPTGSTLGAKVIFAAAIFSAQGTAGTGFTQRSTLQNNVTEDQAITSPGTCSVAGASTATFTNAAQDWIAQMVAFG